MDNTGSRRNKRPHNSNNPNDDQTSVKKPKRVVMRNFPGPAGLLPDNVTMAEDGTSLQLYNDLCSQDSYEMFSKGSWRILQKYNTRNFIDRYDIAFINEKRPRKLSHLIVCVHEIENDCHTRNIRLKFRDKSGVIEGIINGDLAVKFPQIVHHGIVLVLTDVGVLYTQKNFIYQSKIIISEANLIGAFSENGIIVETPILRNLFKKNINESNETCSNSPINDENIYKLLDNDEQLLEAIDLTQFEESNSIQQSNRHCNDLNQLLDDDEEVFDYIDTSHFELAQPFVTKATIEKQPESNYCNKNEEYVADNVSFSHPVKGTCQVISHNDNSEKWIDELLIDSSPDN